MHGIYAQLKEGRSAGGSVKFGVMVCKASMLNCWGVDLPADLPKMSSQTFRCGHHRGLLALCKTNQMFTGWKHQTSYIYNENITQILLQLNIIGSTRKLINTSWKIQNISAKLILKCVTYDNCTDAKCQLHWLPPRKRICFKCIALFHEWLYGNTPHTLKDLIKPTKTKVYSQAWKEKI